MDTKLIEINLKENYVVKEITLTQKAPYVRGEDEIKVMRNLKSKGIVEYV